jgi:hypothetical protein
VVWRRRDAGLASAIADGERSGRHRRRGQAAHLGARLGPMSCSLMVAPARASCGGSVVDVYDAAGLTCRIKRVLPRSAERLKKHDDFPGFLPAHDVIDQRAQEDPQATSYFMTPLRLRGLPRGGILPRLGPCSRGFPPAGSYLVIRYHTPRMDCTTSFEAGEHIMRFRDLD